MKALLFTVPLAMTLMCGSLYADSVASTETVCHNELGPKLCHFSVDGAQYEISPQGRLRKSVPDVVDVGVQLPVADAVIDSVSYVRYEHDLIFVCELDNGESGSGLILRLDSKLGIKWRLKFPTFNLSVGALEDHFLYEAGLGTVAKIDLEQGVFVWKHEGLYDSKLRSFNAFDKPEIGPEQVIFRERLAPQQKSTVHLIRANKLTGKLQID